MSQKHTPEAIRAANLVFHVGEDYKAPIPKDGWKSVWIDEAASIIDREAVQPAVRESERYYDLIVKAHDAIDILLAMLIERDHKILPTKLRVWSTMVALSDAIKEHKALAKLDPLEKKEESNDTAKQ